MKNKIYKGKEYVEPDDGYADYKFALEVAGAKVLAYQTFGSYQGDWLAKVEYEGQQFWIHDYFGSCSGCDAMEAEIESSYGDDGEGYLGHEKEKLAAFGKRYLEPENRLTYEQVSAKAAEHSAYDVDADEMINFVKQHA